jgi:hypothetical protein
MCDDVQLCNRCVCEFLILARTWFAFSLPYKTECDICPSNLPMSMDSMNRGRSLLDHFNLLNIKHHLDIYFVTLDL